MKKKKGIYRVPKERFIRLDVGCGSNKQHGYVGMDIRKIKGVDIVHDAESVPYPLPDGCCDMILMSHMVEHICPKLMLPVMNELWRIMKVEGHLYISTPYAGSRGCWQDPTHCFSEDTDVLTESGWKRINTVQVGERVHTLNIKTMTTELSTCARVINEDYAGPMYHFKTRCMDIMTTPNHDMLYGNGGAPTKKRYWRVGRADSWAQIKGHHTRLGYVTFGYSGATPKTITIPRVGKHKTLPVEFNAVNFMRLMGWYLSEGSLYTKSGWTYNIIIHQSKDVNKDKYNEIHQLIQSLGFSAVERSCGTGVVFSSVDMHAFLHPFGKSHDKYIDPYLKSLDPSLLREMLGTLIKGDGCKVGSGYKYSTVSKRLADDVQEIAVKCGYRTTLCQEIRKDTAVIRGRPVNQSPLIYHVYISRDREAYYPKPSVVPYVGKIVCLTMKDNHIIFVRRNGRCLWSGNCGHWNETTPLYFDPYPYMMNGARSNLYDIYKVRPWRLKENSWFGTGNLQIILEKRRNDEKSK